MKAIAERVGIQPSAIYKHVESKQALLREIVRRATRNLIGEAHLAIASSEDAEAQLARAVRVHVQLHLEDPAIALIAGRGLASLEPQAADEQRALQQEYLSIFERTIARGLHQQRFDALDPRVTARSILRMGRGAAQSLREDASIGTRELCDLYTELALRMVGARR
jgi:AcrR family transcriptional regulator